MNTIQRRLAVLGSHVDPQSQHSPVDIEIGEVSAAVADLDTKSLRLFLDGHDLELRDEIQRLLAEDPLFQVTPKFHNSQKEVQRQITDLRIKRLEQLGYVKYVMSDLQKWLAISETLNLGELSTVVKLAGVHVGLVCGAIRALGTERHHQKYLPDLLGVRLKACFGLTELGHGSNVQGIETTITYDRASDELIVNTPVETAQKHWLGGALGAMVGVIFGQLYVDGENKGVHAAIVPMRDQHGALLPGVAIADCGHKQGLNGVDNGRIWFKNVRVPRENLLNHFGDISANGTYSSPLKTPEERFAASIGALVGGRVFMAGGVQVVARLALAIAIRYGLSRRQFGEGRQETLLMDYPLHQRRLMPLLANLFVYAASSSDIKDLWMRERTPDVMKQIHLVVAGLKPLVTWNAHATLQMCRESCGGQAFGTINRIGTMKNDLDVWLTFEGDNYVLLQQVSRYLLKEYQKQVSAKRFTEPFEFLNYAGGVDGDITSLQFQRQVFNAREASLLKHSATLLMKNLKQFSSPIEAWNASVETTNELAKAHAERHVFEVYVAAVEKAPQQIQAVLHLMRSLFALTKFYDDASFLRNVDALSKHMPNIRVEIQRLCKELRDYAPQLVQSFGIHEALLAPIAKDWVQHYSLANTVNHD